MSNSLWSYGLVATRAFCPLDFPDKNSEVGCRDLLQWVFPTQGSNPGLPHGRQILYHWSRNGYWTQKENLIFPCISLGVSEQRQQIESDSRWVLFVTILKANRAAWRADVLRKISWYRNAESFVPEADHQRQETGLETKFPESLVCVDLASSNSCGLVGLGGWARDQGQLTDSLCVPEHWVLPGQ